MVGITQAAKKAHATMKNASPGKKAQYTRNRKLGAKKAVKKVLDKNFREEKVDFLLSIKAGVKKCCVVCKDAREYVLQEHHVDKEKKHTRWVCANCHDTIRRAGLKELKEAFREK